MHSEPKCVLIIIIIIVKFTCGRTNCSIHYIHFTITDFLQIDVAADSKPTLFMRIPGQPPVIQSYRCHSYTLGLFHSCMNAQSTWSHTVSCTSTNKWCIQLVCITFKGMCREGLYM